MFHDIFSKSREKEIEKTKIIVDNREKNSLVPSELIKSNFDVEFRQLEIADYILNDVAIERKTISDLKNSIINKRVFSQLESIKQYPNHFLIIEGSRKELFNNEGLHENAVRGFLLSAQGKIKVPVIFSENEKETSKYIEIIAKKREKTETPLNPKRTSLNPEEQKQFILESFPGIGPVAAKKLLEKFKSLKKIFTASKEDLEKIIRRKGDHFLDILNSMPSDTSR